MTRTCRVCLAVKELEQFPKAAHGKDGRRNQCTECRKAYHRANSKTYYARNRTDKLQKVKVYAEANKEAIKARMKAYIAQEHRLEIERQRNKLRRQDPDYKRYHANRSRMYIARKQAAPGFATKAQLKARWDYYGGTCWLPTCVNEATEMDHVIPITKGGTNWPANLKPICRSCNARKSNTWPYQVTTS